MERISWSSPRTPGEGGGEGEFGEEENATLNTQHSTLNAQRNHPNPLPGYRESGPEREVRLLFVGVDWGRKSGQTAVDVVRELNRRGVAARLSVVGCRPELAESDRQYVEIIGRLDKSDPADLARLRSLYLKSDFFIMTSRAESYGIVYCEAMASGLPSLATVTGGVGYIVRDDETGRIVEWGPNTVSQLADFVAQKWADPAAYRRLAESTYRTFLEEFNWETSWRRLGKVIDGIAGLT